MFPWIISGWRRLKWSKLPLTKNKKYTGTSRPKPIKKTNSNAHASVFVYGIVPYIRVKKNNNIAWRGVNKRRVSWQYLYEGKLVYSVTLTINGEQLTGIFNKPALIPDALNELRGSPVK